MIEVDQQRERKFRGLVRAALGAHDDVADILTTTDGLLVTLKNRERFLVIVVNETKPAS